VLKQPSLLFNAVSEKVISEPIFAFDLSSEGSELHLGGTDKGYYTGDIQYHPVSLKGSVYWFDQDNGQINVNEKMLSGIKVAVDIRTYRIKGPPNEVEAIYAEMEGGYRIINGLYAFLCGKVPHVGFQWDNKEWVISPEK
jgi:cathepsin D